MPSSKTFMEQYGGKIIGSFIAFVQLLVLGGFITLYNKAEAGETKETARHMELIELINDLNGKVDISLNDDVHHLKSFNELKSKVERHHP